MTDTGMRKQYETRVTYLKLLGFGSGNCVSTLCSFAKNGSEMDMCINPAAATLS